jgi:hypothetical protein
MTLTGKTRRTRRETCHTATLPTTNSIWIDLGANPGLCGEKPATNSLSCSTANRRLGYNFFLRRYLKNFISVSCFMYQFLVSSTLGHRSNIPALFVIIAQGKDYKSQILNALKYSRAII